jgi:phenylacetate-CoA ligase
MADSATLDERFPVLSDHGRRMLQWLREHPHAPRYTGQNGPRLTVEGLRRLGEYEAELRASPVGWKHREVPQWLAEFVAFCFREVPFYRRYGAPPANFFDIPTSDRSDIGREAWSFVPDSLPLDDLVIYGTTGTTGHRILIPSHPIVAACYQPLLRKALTTRGIALGSRRGQVGCAVVGYQRQSFTYASVMPDLDDAGFVKINLNPGDWRAPDDRERFLDSCNPEMYSGDPISLAELAKLPLRTRPNALVSVLFSTSMMLLPGLRQSLQARFGCPVLDIYSTNETGPIAASDEEGRVLLQHRLYVEILDAEGIPCLPGARGEITVTGGFNPYLPLLRYRTGDYACLSFRGTQPVLLGLEGRPPVIFRGTQGQLINNIDVTHALRPFALPQFTLHQAADGMLRLRMRSAPVEESRLREALQALFGHEQLLTIEMVESLGDKVIQYTSDMEMSG